MIIMYRQATKGTLLQTYGITNCYVKHLAFDHDRKTVILKEHYHTGYEIHIIEKGCQIYTVGGKTVTVSAGHFLVIPPMVQHRLLVCAPHTEKFAITFQTSGECLPELKLLSRKTPDEISDNLYYLYGEQDKKRNYAQAIITCRAAETVFATLRLLGAKPRTEQEIQWEENTRFALARQYIHDNVQQALTVSDVAAYCCLSTKQTTRLFDRFAGMSPAAYIREQRIRCIEELLADFSLTLRDISERMHFADEYYFNAYFKKYAGVTPGAYRKTINK